MDVAVRKDTNDRSYLRIIERVIEKPLQYSSWRLEETALYKYVKGKYTNLRGDTEAWKLVFPREERSQAIREHHDDVKCGHAGVYKTYERLAR